MARIHFDGFFCSTNTRFVAQVTKNYNNPILLQITDDLFPYSRFPWCSDEFNKIYMDEQVRFASLLSSNIQKSLVVRLHSNQSILGVDQKFFWNVKAKDKLYELPQFI